MARSDESEPEDRDTVERDALLLAQTYTSQETKVGTGTGCAILVSVEACSLPGDAGLALQPDVWYLALIRVVCSNLFTNRFY